MEQTISLYNWHSLCWLNGWSLTLVNSCRKIFYFLLFLLFIYVCFFTLIVLFYCYIYLLCVSILICTILFMSHWKLIKKFFSNTFLWKNIKLLYIKTQQIVQTSVITIPMSKGFMFRLMASRVHWKGIAECQLPPLNDHVPYFLLSLFKQTSVLSPPQKKSYQTQVWVSESPSNERVKSHLSKVSNTISLQTK